MRHASTGNGARIVGALFVLMLFATGCEIPPLGGGEEPPEVGASEDDATTGDEPADPADDGTSEEVDHSEHMGGSETSSEDASEDASDDSGDDAPAPSGGMNSDLMPEVDESAIPEGAGPRRDIDIRTLVDTTPVGVPDHGFRIVCDYSHMNFDDPIVFPGQSRATHLHTFFGNTTADANSTVDSLMAGDTTCIGGRAGNRSSYWVPAMIDTRSAAPIAPSFYIVYYKSFVSGDRGRIQPVPNNLRMITGSSDFTAAQAPSNVSYSCGGNNGGGALPDCTGPAELKMSVAFPNCWDGENLDSDDHRSHMTYSSGTGCPDSHPELLPTITQNVTYQVPAGTNPRQHWRLSSDMYADSQPGGFSGHGDVFLAWADGVAEWFRDNCVVPAASCTVGSENPQ
jgi:hypothetical protein